MHLYDPPHSLTQDVVISSTSDEFYAKNMYSNYGEELHLWKRVFSQYPPCLCRGPRSSYE
jgi:hypothetical protein